MATQPDTNFYTSAAPPGSSPGKAAEKAMKTGSSAKRYSSGTTKRQPYLDRARRLSRLTVSSLFREEGEAESGADQTVAWQSLGAWGVNSLSGKETLALFPSGISFVKLKPGRAEMLALMEMDETERGELKAAIDRALSGVEIEFVECIEEDGDRVQLFDAKRHLIVGGSHCIFVGKDAMLASIALDRFVTWRTSTGQLLEWVIETVTSYAALEEDIQELIKDHGWENEDDAGNEVDPDRTIKVYTHGKWVRGKWKVHQEVCGQVVPDTEWTFTDEALPWLFLREVVVAGEHYGRSYVEDYEGDLQTLDGFWQILTEGAAASAILKWLIKAGGTTNKKTFEGLPNGGVMTGDVDDVAAVRAEKGGDLNFAFKVAEKIEQRLERVFLLYSSIQRQGERVTREEIVTVRQDLDNTIGGVYANSVTTFQAPYAKLKMAALMRLKRMRPLPKDSVKVTVLTGEAGIGRAAKDRDLDDLMLSAAQALQENPAMQYIKVRNFLERKFANKQIDPDGLLLSQEEFDAEAQKAQTAAMAQQVAPEVAKAGGQMLMNQQQQQQEAPV